MVKPKLIISVSTAHVLIIRGLFCNDLSDAFGIIDIEIIRIS